MSSYNLVSTFHSHDHVDIPQLNLQSGVQKTTGFLIFQNNSARSFPSYDGRTVNTGKREEIVGVGESDGCRIGKGGGRSMKSWHGLCCRKGKLV